MTSLFPPQDTVKRSLWREEKLISLLIRTGLPCFAQTLKSIGKLAQYMQIEIRRKLRPLQLDFITSITDNVAPP